MEPASSTSRSFKPFKELVSPRKKRKVSHFSESEKLNIINVFKYVKESWPGDKYASKQGMKHKTADILGISKSAVYRILKEYTETDTVKPPASPKKRLSLIEKINDFDKSCIRQIVHSFYLKGELPTAKKVLDVINADESLPKMGLTSLKKLLKHLKFKVPTYSQQQKNLTEKNNINQLSQKEKRKEQQQKQCVYHSSESLSSETDCASTSNNKIYHSSSEHENFDTGEGGLSSMTTEMSSSKNEYEKAQILETKEFNSNDSILRKSPSEGLSGFRCNECLCDISGFRYTCVQCSAWDLCGQCELQGAHAHHYVLRVPASATPMESREVKEKIYDSLLDILRSQTHSEETPVTTQVREEYLDVAVKDEFIEEIDFENHDLNFYTDLAPHCSSSLPIETEVDIVIERIKHSPDPLNIEKEESDPNRAHVEQFSINGKVVKSKGEDQNRDSKPIKVSKGEKPFVKENPIIQTQNEFSYLIEEDCGVSSHN